MFNNQQNLDESYPSYDFNSNTQKVDSKDDHSGSLSSCNELAAFESIKSGYVDRIISMA